MGFQAVALLDQPENWTDDEEVGAWIVFQSPSFSQRSLNAVEIRARAVSRRL